jgi:hypothetical protein
MGFWHSLHQKRAVGHNAKRRSGLESLEQYSRGVAQPGSAPALGAGGPRFKSARPDQIFRSRFRYLPPAVGCRTAVFRSSVAIMR